MHRLVSGAWRRSLISLPSLPHVPLRWLFATASAAPASADVKVPVALVKQLRESTGAPMMECRNALAAPDVACDIEKAIDWLRKKGMAAASKKAGRTAAQGLIATALHPSGLAGIMIEVRGIR